MQGRHGNSYCSPHLQHAVYFVNSPDQLVLEDDPALNTDFALPGLDAELSLLAISSNESSRRSSILFPHSQRSSVTSYGDREGNMLGFIIPSSDTENLGNIGGLSIQSDHSSIHPQTGMQDRHVDDNFDIDPGFIVDENGEILQIENIRTPPQKPNSETAEPSVGRAFELSGVLPRESEGGDLKVYGEVIDPWKDRESGYLTNQKSLKMV